MSESKRIKTALVSVYHKEGLDEIITKLHEEGVEFLSTGGTRQFIESLGYPCKAVEDLNTYPSILGGRVKTLHPKIFGGILCRRGLEQDLHGHIRSLPMKLLPQKLVYVLPDQAVL